MNTAFITKNLRKTFAESLGNSQLSVIANAPLSNLLQPLNTYVTLLQSRQSGYDSMVMALTANTDFLDDDEDLTDVVDYRKHITEISDDVGDAFADGLVNAAMLINDATNQVTSDTLTLTSSAGQVFAMQIGEFEDVTTGEVTRVRCVTKTGYTSILSKTRDGINKLNTRLCPVTSIFNDTVSSASSFLDSIQNMSLLLCAFANVKPGSTVKDNLYALKAKLNLSGDTLLDISQSLAAHYGLTPRNSILENLSLIIYEKKALNPNVYIPENGASILAGSVASSELNNFLSVAAQSICSASFTRWFSSMKETISDKSKVVRTFFSRLATHYAQGGLRGAIQFILTFARGGKSMTDSDGLLTFTDNKALLPREFIVGIIGQIVGIVSTVVSLIVSIFSKVIGAILMVVGSILWSVIGSIFSTESDTRASYTVISDYNDEIALLPCAPLAIAQGTVTFDSASRVEWYDDLVELGTPVIYMSVPGGIVFVGPGSYSDDGSTITSIRWEFHPSTTLFNWGMTRDQFVGWIGHGMVLPYSSYNLISLSKIAAAGGDAEVERKWNAIMGDLSYQYLNINNDPTSGHLSEWNDRVAVGSSAFCSTIFLLWLCFKNRWFYDYVASSLGWEVLLGDPEEPAHPGMGSLYFCCIEWFTGNSDTPTANVWADLVNAAVNLCDVNDESSILLLLQHEQNEQWEIVEEYHGLTEMTPAFRNIFSHGMFYGEANIFPDTMEYAIHLPRYNASTYWKWVATTAVATAAVAATAVIATVKYKQFAKRKRAENIAKFNDVQGTYQSAINGTRTEIDPETGRTYEVTFDPNSEEGRAYVKAAYKDYKRTARSNNRWAKIIGGTRYDIGTFYGEAEDESEAISALDTASTDASLGMRDIIAESLNDPAEQAVDSEAYGPSIVSLIKGYEQAVE